MDGGERRTAANGRRHDPIAQRFKWNDWKSKALPEGCRSRQLRGNGLFHQENWRGSKRKPLWTKLMLTGSIAERRMERFDRVGRSKCIWQPSQPIWWTLQPLEPQSQWTEECPSIRSWCSTKSRAKNGEQNSRVVTNGTDWTTAGRICPAIQPTGVESRSQWGCPRLVRSSSLPNARTAGSVWRARRFTSQRNAINSRSTSLQLDWNPSPIRSGTSAHGTYFLNDLL